jgi:hypothetical protein
LIGKCQTGAYRHTTISGILWKFQKKNRSRQFSPTVLPNFPRRPTIHPPFHRGSPGSPTNFAPSETVPRHVKLPITSRDITVLHGDLTRCALDAQARLGYHIGILMGHRYHATCVYVYNICMYVMSCHVMYMYMYIYIYIYYVYNYIYIHYGPTRHMAILMEHYFETAEFLDLAKFLDNCYGLIPGFPTSNVFSKVSIHD